MHVTVLRPEVRIPWYFNRKVYTFVFVKGGLAFALSACGEGPRVLLLEHWAHLITASEAGARQLASALCLLTWHPEPGDRGTGELSRDSQTFPRPSFPPGPYFFCSFICLF